MCIRDSEKRSGKKADLERTLNRVVRREEFAEEFFKKPLETLLLLTSSAEQVIMQLTTVLSSYESLMEKLEAVSYTHLDVYKRQVYPSPYGEYVSCCHRPYAAPG